MSERETYLGDGLYASGVFRVSGHAADKETATMKLNQVTPCVVRVGGGRGFVVQEERGFRNRLIITAAHCLPFFPPCHAASNLNERTFEDLLAPIDEEPSIWAECLFVDPIADIAAALGRTPSNRSRSGRRLTDFLPFIDGWLS